jgi:hypothetical protein
MRYTPAEAEESAASRAIPLSSSLFSSLSSVMLAPVHTREVTTHGKTGTADDNDSDSDHLEVHLDRCNYLDDESSSSSEEEEESEDEESDSDTDIEGRIANFDDLVHAETDQEVEVERSIPVNVLLARDTTDTSLTPPIGIPRSPPPPPTPTPPPPCQFDTEIDTEFEGDNCKREKQSDYKIDHGSSFGSAFIPKSPESVLMELYKKNSPPRKTKIDTDSNGKEGYILPTEKDKLDGKENTNCSTQTTKECTTSKSVRPVCTL